MGPVLWCVGTLKFFKVPCVWGPCVVVCEDIEFFQSSPVCGLCAVVCQDFEFFKVPLCVKLCPCTGEIEFSQKIPVLGIFPCAGEIGFFRVKIPVLGNFPRWWSTKAPKKRRWETEVKTLTKLFHELPARCNEIYRPKGGGIRASWSYEKSPCRCTCKLCSS